MLHDRGSIPGGTSFFRLAALIVGVLAGFALPTPVPALGGVLPAATPGDCAPEDLLESRSHAGSEKNQAISSAPSTVLQRLIGPELVEPTQREGLRVEAVSVGADYQVRKARESDDLQVIGSTDRVGEVLRFGFQHTWGCGPNVTPLLPSDNTGLLSLAPSQTDGTSAVTLGRPWAIDSAGTPVNTWYEIDGETVIQVVDATWAKPPVYFDPTYTSFGCPGYWSTLNAATYLDLDTADTPACPTRAMFTATNSYFPVWGYETNIANDAGKVAVKLAGSCSPPSTGTGPYWDFNVPCKAHDYCYDLRKASFSNTVSDADCDQAFYSLMLDHCNDRVFRADCEDVAETYYFGVSLPGVVTPPSPGIVEIRQDVSGKCVDVEGPSVANFAPFQQWSCNGAGNQRFRIWPATEAGAFQIIAEHSQSCARTPGGGSNLVYQFTCFNTYHSERFRIQGALNQNLYSLRSRITNFNSCWLMFGSFANGADIVDAGCDDYNNWFLWRIVDP